LCIALENRQHDKTDLEKLKVSEDK
jgi:hypothetical protein